MSSYWSFVDDLDWSMTGNEWWEVLEVDKNSTTDQIKQKYKSLCKKYHPDVNKTPNATKRFNTIQDAYREAII